MGYSSIIYCYVADLFLGDPEWFPHPVRGMGRLIGFLDHRLRGNSSKWTERIKGMVLVFSVVGITLMVAYLFVELLRKINPLLGTLSLIYLGYTTLAIKDLQVKVRTVLKELKNNSIVKARLQLSRIVGRDTQDLNEEEIITAAIESIAENTNDGIIAPLFYLILGGPLLAITYKAINTLDSMVGYSNEKYLHFGWFSAKLDDLANFIPARLCGFLIATSSFILSRGFKKSFKTMLRDGRKHPSPNSGISEAAMAGALEIGLGGVISYQGILMPRPLLGVEKNTIRSSLINKALTISFISSVLMVSTGVVLKWMI